jgi:hypothetical protein
MTAPDPVAVVVDARHELLRMSAEASQSAREAPAAGLGTFLRSRG